MIFEADTPQKGDRGLYFYSTQGGSISVTVSLQGRSYEALPELTTISGVNGYVYLPECLVQFTGTGDLVLEPVAGDKR